MFFNFKSLILLLMGFFYYINFKQMMSTMFFIPQYNLYFVIIFWFVGLVLMVWVKQSSLLSSWVFFKMFEVLVVIFGVLMLMFLMGSLKNIFFMEFCNLLNFWSPMHSGVPFFLLMAIVEALIMSTPYFFNFKFNKNND